MHAASETYRDGSTEFEGYLAHDGARDRRRPAVLVFHQWSGCSDFERSKADWLAGLGYAALAVDMYGKGRRGSNPQENGALMTPLVEDRGLLRRRAEAAIRHLKSLPMVDTDRIGAIGFCFGGLCVLDLARANAPGLRAAVAFHALFMPPALGAQPPIKAKVLALHGYDDPMATPEAMVGLANEMTAAKADWQVVAYGATGHAFTNPHAHDHANGMFYREVIATRAFKAMENLLAEAL